jgi:hypothetical protein
MVLLGAGRGVLMGSSTFPIQIAQERLVVVRADRTSG